MGKMSKEDREELEAKLRADDEDDDADDDGGIEVAVFRGPGVHSMIEKMFGPSGGEKKKDKEPASDDKDNKAPSSSKWFKV